MRTVAVKLKRYIKNAIKIIKSGSYYFFVLYLKSCKVKNDLYTLI